MKALIMAVLFAVSLQCNAYTLQWHEKDIVQRVLSVVEKEDEIVRDIVKRRSTKVDEETLREIVRAVMAETANHPFPSFSDVMGLIEVESTFNPRAVSRGNVGLAQINWQYHHQKFSGKWDAFQIRKNVAVSVEYLRELRSISRGNRGVAIMSYNIGPYAFKAGKRNQRYLWKVNVAAERYRSIIEG